MKKILLILLLFTSTFFIGCKESPVDPTPEPEEENEEEKEEKINYYVEIDDIGDSCYIGEEIQLSAKVYPETVSQDVTWSIKKAVSYEINTPAELDGNTLKTLNYGKIYITAESNEIIGLSDTILFEVKHELLEEDIDKVTTIIGFYGEDASTTYNVHYMNHNTKASVEYTTADDANFSDYFTAEQSGYFFENLDEAQATIWPARNVWDASLVNLTPGTEYIYRINNGDNTYSDTYHFTTADNSTNTSFLFITDNHYAAFSDGTDRSAAVSETAIKNALAINPNISFIVGGGDRIDTGGNEDIWDIYFNSSLYSRTNLPYIDTPGNHELYFAGTGQRDSTYHKLESAGPDNGEGEVGTSNCWFIYNDILFIMLDNGKGVGDLKQVEWMRNLLETKEYRHSIIVNHDPFDQGSGYYQEYLDICDKYAVDLVLDGHYHTQQIRRNVYEGETSTNEYLGTTFVRGAFSGVKSATSYDQAINQAKVYIVDVTENNIQIRVMYANGTIVSTFDIPYHKGDIVNDVSEEELINSITSSYDEENNKFIVSWSNDFYGNVTRVDLSENTFINTSNYSVCPTPGYTSLSLSGVTKGKIYKFNLTVTFKSGNTYTTTIEEDLSPNINLKTENVFEDFAEISFGYCGDELLYTMDVVEVYLNGKKVLTLGLNEYRSELNKFNLYDLKSKTDYTLELRYIDYYGKTVMTKQINFKTE